MKILQINTVYRTGSTGRIVADLNEVLQMEGMESYIAYGRGVKIKRNNIIKIGNKIDCFIHGLASRVLDLHGFFSKRETEKFLRIIDELNPDIIHLHNLHGYYINIEKLFSYLKKTQKPVVWLLHDCWPFTGHCAYFEYTKCDKWKYLCSHCPQKSSYPKANFLDNSLLNYLSKKKIFTSLNNLYLITPSKWLANLVKQSFLFKYPVKVINNGVDLSIFKPHLNNFRKKNFIENKYIVLGVANIWDARKGFKYMLELSDRLPDEFQVVLVGLSSKQMKELPKKILGLQRTNNVYELADIYASSNVFVNPTLEDNFPTTNLEALASGIPVITFNSGGSGEAVEGSRCGFIIEKENVEKMIEKIFLICNGGKEKYEISCRERALNLYENKKKFKEYLNLYREIYKSKNYKREN